MRPHRALSRFKRGHRRRDDVLGEVYDQGVPQAVLGGSEGTHESRRGKVRNNHDDNNDNNDDNDDHHDNNHNNHDHDSQAPSRLSHDGRVEHGQEQKDTPVRGS